MKIRAVCFALVCLAVLAVAGKPEFHLYGFVKGDMYVASNGVFSFGRPSLVAVNQAAGTDSAATSFTAQHSRFGFRGGDSLGAVATGGVIELDFFVNASNFTAARSRLRLAYAWCEPVPDLSIRIGQQWDIFSPLNPETVNTGAVLWRDGNFGYRRPQIQFRYAKSAGAVKPSIQVSGGEAASENELQIAQDTAKTVTTGTFLGLDNLGIPLLQARLGCAIGGIVEIGASGAYASFGAPRRFATEGWSFDVSITVNRFFALKSELGGGRNLGDANLQSIAGNRRTADLITNGIWVNVVSKPATFFAASLGFGREGVNSHQSPGDVTSNLTIYGDLIFPLTDHFSFAAEYQWLRTALQEAPGAKNAHVVDIAGTVRF